MVDLFGFNFFCLGLICRRCLQEVSSLTKGHLVWLRVHSDLDVVAKHCVHSDLDVVAPQWCALLPSKKHCTVVSMIDDDENLVAFLH